MHGLHVLKFKQSVSFRRVCFWAPQNPMGMRYALPRCRRKDFKHLTLEFPVERVLMIANAFSCYWNCIY